MNHCIWSVVEMNKLFKDVILCDVWELYDFLKKMANQQKVLCVLILQTCLFGTHRIHWLCVCVKIQPWSATLAPSERKTCRLPTPTSLMGNKWSSLAGQKPQRENTVLPTVAYVQVFYWKLHLNNVVRPLTELFHDPVIKFCTISFFQPGCNSLL